MIKEFNLSVLGKRCWRLKEVRESLWFRVLSAKHGEEGGTISDGGRFASSWWKNLLSIGSGVGVGFGNWFDDNLRRDVGDDTKTLFWYDPWLDGGVLIDIISRLFALADNKMVIVEDMFRVGGGQWGLKMEATFVGLGGRKIEEVLHVTLSYCFAC